MPTKSPMKMPSPPSPLAPVVDQMHRFAADLDRMIRTSLDESSSRLASLLANRQQDISKSILRLADAALLRHLQALDEVRATWNEASQRWARALVIVQTELPQRGWYLSDEAPLDLIDQIARKAEVEDWAGVDQLIVEHVGHMRLDNDHFRQWLVRQGVPDYSISRIRLVLEYRERENHTITAIVGITVIDEFCRCLYDGRDFTTKRNRQPRPQLACQITTEGARALSQFAHGFVDVFGSIQEDIDPARLDDEDYFNRAAIVHGKMRRDYGPKDSAKVFLVLMFLVLGLEDDEEGGI